MSRSRKPEPHFPVKLTQAQRKAVAEIAPQLADRLKLEEPNQRTIALTPAELKAVEKKTAAAVRQAAGAKRNLLRRVQESTEQALESSRGAGAVPATARIYQFKITLENSKPPIWRRIQVPDCTLEELHEHIQTAMGWTNSHLHHFRINDTLYGDPLLMAENFAEMGYQDSTAARLTDFLPRSGEGTSFEYEYDFGDSWWHAIHFEGVVRAEPGRPYPLCLEGERACPPEDVGGPWGYEEFLEALADPDHERNEELLEWVGGSFDPEAFDPAAATRSMHRGLPDWRRML